MANDRDDRVRVAAVKALMTCTETEQGLSCDLYDIIKKVFSITDC